MHKPIGGDFIMAKKLDISKLAERLNQLNESNNRGNSGGLSFLSIKDGRNVIRILPPRDDMDSFALEAWVHYGIGKSDKHPRGQMVVCPTTNDENASCPICELSSELKNLSKKKDDSYDKQARSFYRKKRVYYNAINRADDLSKYEKREEDGNTVWYNTETDEKESPVKVYASGIGVFKDLIALICDPEYGDITDAEEGLDVIITKSGSGQFNTNYDVKTVRKESPIGFDEWEVSLNDLKPLLKAKTYDELAKMLDGGSGSEEEEPQEEEESKEDDNSSTEEPESEDEGLQDEIQAALARRRNKK